MKSKTEKILTVLRVLAWMGVFGYAVNLGSQIICLVVSFFNPAAAVGIPGTDDDLSTLIQYDFWSFVYVMHIVIIMSAMFLYLWYQVATLLSKLNLKSPFTIQVSHKLESIAIWIFAIWVAGFIGTRYVNWLSKRIGDHIDLLTVGAEFLFTAGIVYMVSQIFKHGIEIQEENQKTI